MRKRRFVRSPAGGSLLSSVLVAGSLVQQVYSAPVKLDVDHSRSYIVAVARKGGVFGFAAGHEHGILAAEWSADICLDNADPKASSTSITIASKSLRIDTEEARRVAGLKGKGPGANDIQQIQEKMLGSANLDAQGHPEIRFQTSSADRKDNDVIVLTGPLTIRGRSRVLSAPVKIERPDDDAFAFSGEFKVRQTDYGIKPESVGGVVTVKDAIEIRFRFYAKPSGVSCK